MDHRASRPPHSFFCIMPEDSWVRAVEVCDGAADEVTESLTHRILTDLHGRKLPGKRLLTPHGRLLPEEMVFQKKKHLDKRHRCHYCMEDNVVCREHQFSLRVSGLQIYVLGVQQMGYEAYEG